MVDITANQKFCLGSRCMTAQQFNHILDMEAAAGAPTVGNGAPAAEPYQVRNDGPPIISINGENPANVHVGATYADLGATITRPQADLKLGIHTFVDGHRHGTASSQ